MKRACLLLAFAFAFLFVFGWAAGCVAPGPLGGDLAGYHPALLPADDQLVWFRCRWPEGTLRVALHGARDEADRKAVALALTAWERERIGIRFDVAEANEPPDLDLWISEDPPESSVAGRTGHATSDCDASRGPLDARLVRARVDVARSTGPDWRGHRRELTEEERVGSLIHEIGHALGFSGHSRRAADPMAAAPEVVRRIGRRAIRAEPIDARSLRALYAEGRSLLATVPLASGRTEDFDIRSREALQRGWHGPLVRVGQRSARIRWTEQGTPRSELLVPRVGELLRAPDTLVLVPIGP